MKKLGTMDVILVIVGTFLAVFTVAMVLVYIFTGGIPDTLVTCVFAVCGGECGVMGWIKTSKDKHQARQWQTEDREYAKENGEICTFAVENPNYTYNNYGENENIVE